MIILTLELSKAFLFLSIQSELSMSVSISIIVPVYAGEHYLSKLVTEVSKVKKDWENQNFPCYISELIFVDDDSKDNSRQVLETFKDIEWVHRITLAKNYGQHPATTAGISYSSGDWVVTLDEDLQHHPRHIIEMLKLGVHNSSDVIYANSIQAVHQSYFRDLSSRYYKKMMKYLSKNAFVSNFNSFRLLRGSVARSAASVAGHDSYLDIVLSWFTNKVTIYSTNMVDERYVETGQSGYNLNRLLSHARRLLMTSDAKMLRAIAILGVCMLLVSIIMALYIIVNKLFFPETISSHGWTSLIVTNLIIGSGVTIALSVIAEYLAIVVQHIHGKPTYSVVDRSKDKILQTFFKDS